MGPSTSVGAALLVQGLYRESDWREIRVLSCTLLQMPFRDSHTLETLPAFSRPEELCEPSLWAAWCSVLRSPGCH